MLDPATGGYVPPPQAAPPNPPSGGTSGQRTEAPRKKGIYIGAPACFALDLACKHLHAAFCENAKFGGIYIVGSCLERADWRDVDVRMILDDAAFKVLFPDAQLVNAAWEHDPRWAVMVTAISQWLSQQTGLPIDFQFQPMTFANERHKKPRSACGVRYAKRTD